MIEGLPYSVVNKVPMTMWKGFKDARIHLINTMEEWRAFYELLMQQKLVACDTETSGFDWFAGCKIVGMSFGWGNDHFYIPVRHEKSVLGGDPPPQIDIEDIKDDIIKFFAQKDVFTIFHNAKFDVHFFETEGIPVLTPYHDTLILWQLYDENAPGKLKIIASGWRDIMRRWHKGLVHKDANKKEKEVDKWRSDEARARKKVYNRLVMAKADELQTLPKYQAYKRNDLKKLIKAEILTEHPYQSSVKDDIHYGMVPVELMCEYAGMDTYMTWVIYNHVMKKLDMTGPLRSLYINELKLSKVLTETETTGIEVDAKFLRDLSAELAVTIRDKEAKILTELGAGQINLASTDQLAAALLNYGVELTKMTDAEKPKLKLDAGVLNKLKHEHSIIGDILDLRADKKIKGTYADGILSSLVDGHLLHCNFNQNVTTGRMSAREPNLMNIPRGNKIIRKAFNLPSDDYFFLFADYSQVEIRLLAHFSQDPLLLSAFAQGQDVHLRTMCEMFNYDYDYVKNIMDTDQTHPQYSEFKELRAVAKTINFLIIYGGGARSLSEQIDPRPEAYKFASEKVWIAKCQEFIDTYMYTYIGVKRYLNTVKAEVRKNAIIFNTFGRARRLPEVNAVRITRDIKLKWMKAKAERKGANYGIQGEAADVFKVAVVRVHEILKPTRSRLVNFVHDEIQGYIHKEEVALLKPIKKAMEDFDYSVKLAVDIAWSTTHWADKKELAA